MKMSNNFWHQQLGVPTHSQFSFALQKLADKFEPTGFKYVGDADDEQVRELLADSGATDFDTAKYCDPDRNYTLSEVKQLLESADAKLQATKAAKTALQAEADQRLIAKVLSKPKLATEITEGSWEGFKQSEAIAWSYAILMCLRQMAMPKEMLRREMIARLKKNELTDYFNLSARARKLRSRYHSPLAYVIDQLEEGTRLTSIGGTIVNEYHR